MMKKRTTWIAVILIPVMIILLAPMNLSASWIGVFYEHSVGDFNRFDLTSDMAIFAAPGIDAFSDLNFNPISGWSGSFDSPYHIGAFGNTLDTLVFNINFDDNFHYTPFSFEFYGYNDNTMLDWATITFDGVESFAFETHPLNQDVIPEPGTLLLLGSGLLGFAIFGRKLK